MRRITYIADTVECRAVDSKWICKCITVPPYSMFLRHMVASQVYVDKMHLIVKKKEWVVWTEIFNKNNSKYFGGPEFVSISSDTMKERFKSMKTDATKKT